MSELIPQLNYRCARLVVEYFDDFAPGTVRCITRNRAKDFEDFQTHVAPHMEPRYSDDDLFSGHFNFSSDTSTINGVLGQLYRAGMSFFPQTIRRIARVGGPFGDWLACEFPCQLEQALLSTELS